MTRAHALRVMEIGCIVLLAAALAQAGEAPKRLTRAESFLGIHYDFHAGKDCTEVGKNTTRAMVLAILDQVKPDYIQVDCKGHAGYSSYPTKVGNQAPGFVGDPLRIWRDVTAERGVALFMHYSGVWDSRAIALHPDWGVVNADGKVNGNATSFWGPYAKELLIPQLRELAGVYGVDGVWVDGECWASVPDYSEAALKAFREATGITDVPKKPGDPHWFEFLEFHREAFRKYLRNYIAEVKKTNPSFQICSNWAYTDHMAEPVSAPVDFLSGDYSPENSVNSARLSGRFLQRQGKPWDLMAWSFSRKPSQSGSTQKTAPQLQREAAVVVALGGGFQAYFKQKRDGSVYLEHIPVMAQTAAFCRERQATCHRSEPVPQVAVLLSTAGHYRKINGLFPRDLGRVSAAMEALLENQYSVEVLAEHQFGGRMGQYGLIVVPQWAYLEPAFRDQLIAYVNAGGSLLLTGPESAALFAKELGEIPAGQVAVKPLGKGQIAGMSGSFASMWSKQRDAARTQMGVLAGRLFPEPAVRVKGSRDVDVCLMRKDGKTLVNLVNCSGPHATEPIIESIAPVRPVQVSVRLDRRPSAVKLEPGNRAAQFNYRDGAVTVTVPKVDIHEIVVIEP